MNLFSDFPAQFSPNNDSSKQPFVQLPVNLLDIFIPGYGTISRILLETFGFDITLIVSVSFVIFALVKSVAFLKTQILSMVMRSGTCEVQIASDVDTYFWVTDWLADRGIGKNSHSLIAIPPNRRNQDTNIQLDVGLFPPDTDPTRAVAPPSPFSKVPQPQRYQPSLGLYQYFWYKGNFFM
jgi:chaperone BCS1